MKVCALHNTKGERGRGREDTNRIVSITTLHTGFIFAVFSLPVRHRCWTDGGAARGHALSLVVSKALTASHSSVTCLPPLTLLENCSSPSHILKSRPGQSIRKGGLSVCLMSRIPLAMIAGRKCLVKCLFVFGLTKAERAQVGDDVRTFRRAKHPALLALQDVISEPEVGQQSLSFRAHYKFYSNHIAIVLFSWWFRWPFFCQMQMPHGVPSSWRHAGFASGACRHKSSQSFKHPIF